MMTRRKFLQIVAWCGAALAVDSLAWLESFTSVFDRGAARFLALMQSPEQRLCAHFDYLDLDSAGVEQYFADYQRSRPMFSRRLPLSQDVHTRYLLSTDFFRHGADESRRIHYVGFYDPYVTPCNNPLAGFEGERQRQDAHF